jgi:deoxyribose-phosphate aldolase
MSSSQDGIDPKTLGHYIDHTLLRPDAKEPEILQLCSEAVEYGFKTVCVERRWLSVVSARLKGSAVLPIAVIGFPGGQESTSEKVEQTRQAVAAGAREIDMVLNRVWLKSTDYQAVWRDMRNVVEAAAGLPVKVILENSELSEREKILACGLVKAAGAHFVKTSTGFSKSGATEEDVRLMRATVGPEFGVKASGGIRTYADAVKMIRAGATRLGTSASVAIVRGSTVASGAY